MSELEVAALDQQAEGGPPDSSSSSDSDIEDDVEQKPEWMTEENELSQTCVWLVTFAAVLDLTALQSETPLRTLAAVTREVVRDAVLEAVANPVRENPRGGRPSTVVLSVEKLVIFLEEPKHFHVAMKLSSKTRFLPLKLALRRRSGFATHWSQTHSQWWSVVRYGTFTTPKKPVVDAEPLTWHVDGAELNLFEESQEPFNATAMKRRREVAAMRAAGDAVRAGGKIAKTERFTVVDFKALVAEEGLATPNAVMEYAQMKGSAVLLAFVCRQQGRLKMLLEEAEAWASAPSAAAAEREGDWPLMQRLAQESCVCSDQRECQWHIAVQAFFKRNAATIDEGHFAACLAKVICEGPGKKSRVPLLAGVTNAGKSTVLDSLDDVFGADLVFHTPAVGASMPLANLASKPKRFIYFDEFQPVSFAAHPRRAPTLPVTTFLKLFAGQQLEVQVPLNMNQGNADLKWTRGAAITSKLQGLWDIQDCVGAEDVRHMKSRVEQFVAQVPVPPGDMRVVPKCRTFFAKWLVTSSAVFAARVVPIVVPQPVMDQSMPPLVEGLAALSLEARLPAPAVAAFNSELLAMGAVHVNELGPREWPHLHAWNLLRPLEQRRLACSVGSPA
jgi:hypothetical protein